MRTLLVFLLVLLLLGGVSASASQEAELLISPSEHQWIEQGDKLLLAAHWSLNDDVKKIEWRMDGVIFMSDLLQGESGTAYAFLHASDYPVKTSASGDISSYELGCTISGAPAAIVPYAWEEVSGDQIMVYICPPSDETAPESPLDVPPLITSLSWQKTDSLVFELAWTPVQGAFGYEIFAKAGPEGEYEQHTECSDTSVLVGFSLPTEETIYCFKVRAAIYITQDGNEHIHVNGPFSPEVSISVPASGPLSWKTLTPILTPNSIPRITPTPPSLVTFCPQLKTSAPLLPVITPSPTPRPLQPVQTTIRFPVLPNPTATPVRPH